MASIAAALAVGSMQFGGVDVQLHAALEQLLDLLGVGEAQAARQAAGVDDQPVEDVHVGIGEHVIDHAHMLTGAVVDVGALAEHEIGDRRSEVGHRV